MVQSTYTELFLQVWIPFWSLILSTEQGQLRSDCRGHILSKSSDRVQQQANGSSVDILFKLLFAKK